MNKHTLSLLLFLLLVGKLYAQVRVSGVVLNSQDGKRLYNAEITLVETGQVVESDRIGYFQFIQVPQGSYSIRISKDGYEILEKGFLVEKDNVDLGEMTLQFSPNEIDVGIITLTDDELASDNVSNQSGIGLLQASRDVFAETAAFQFGAYWFDVRGLENKYSEVLFNGIPMNKINNGRVNFANWGGLNDITRRPFENTIGIDPSDNVFGDAAGVTYIDTRPSQLRTGTSLAYSLSNRSYRQRLTATHNTGLNKKGWGFTVSGARRWAEEGAIEGTFYDSYAYYLAVEKKLNSNHSLLLTAFGAPTRRAGSSPNTREVFDLRGPDYNAYWGLQNGEMRSERVSRNHEPIAQISHFWNLSDKSKLRSTLSYQFGLNSRSRLERYNAPNASPIYYQNLPSFFEDQALRNDDVIDPSEQAVIDQVRDNWRNDFGTYQLDWDALYAENALVPEQTFNGETGRYSAYYVAADRNDDKTTSFNTHLTSSISDVFTLHANVVYQHTNSHNYREVVDLLGGDFVRNQDDFNFDQSFDVDNPDITRGVGEDVEYNFDLNRDYGEVYLLGTWRWKVLDLKLGGKLGYTAYNREGNYRHYAFLENSKGKSATEEFLDVGIKTQLLYKVDGRNFIRFNGAFYTNAPTAQEVFPNPRLSSFTTPNLERAKIYSGDLSYILRAKKIKARATGYFTQFQDEVEIGFFFAELATANANNVFVAEVLQGVDRRHFGTELAIEAEIIPQVTVSGVAAIGQYTYSNNPNLYLFSEDFANLDGGFQSQGQAFIDGYKVSGTPQQAYSLGLEYSSPKYWWVGVSGNYLAQNYVDIAPLLRTQNFVTNPLTNQPYPGATEEVLQDLLRQEQFSNEFMLNLNAGKTIRFGDYYMGISLSVNNVLNNRAYTTGGFEQGRIANFPDYQLDASRDRPVFANSRVWLDRGTTYFLNIFLRL